MSRWRGAGVNQDVTARTDGGDRVVSTDAVPAVRRRIVRFLFRLAVIFGFAGAAWLVGTAVASADPAPTPAPPATAQPAAPSGLLGSLTGTLTGTLNTTLHDTLTTVTAVTSGNVGAVVSDLTGTVSHLVPAVGSLVTTTTATVTSTATGVTATLGNTTGALLGHPATAPVSTSSSAPKAAPQAAPAAPPVATPAPHGVPAPARWIATPAVVAMDLAVPAPTAPRARVTLDSNAPGRSPLPQPTSPDPVAPTSSISSGHGGAGLTKGLTATLSASTADIRARALGMRTHRPAVVAGRTAGLPSTSPD